MAICKDIVDTIGLLSYIMAAEDAPKRVHTDRVAYAVRLMAERLVPFKAGDLFLAALMHDIGVFDFSNDLIHTPNVGKLHRVKVHPQRAATIVSALPGFQDAARMILQHHERIDGLGYPLGLGAQIMPEANILRFCDAAALVFDRDPTASDETFWCKMEAGRDLEYRGYILDVARHRLDAAALSALRTTNGIAEMNAEYLCSLSDGHPAREEGRVALLQFLGRVLDAKHSYTEGHSRRVAYYAELIALALNLPETEVSRIGRAAYMHDIGKVLIPRSILDNPGRLSADDFERVKAHAEFSRHIVESVDCFSDLADIVGADQEHWDGSGYPKGLKGDAITLGARIILVSDAYDAMTSTRSYRKAMPQDEALEELRKHAGSDFDPRIVDIAARLFDGFEHSVFTSESSTMYQQQMPT
jgi:HD-GYP domain-containing protein (c-di-GMP phosphodiesterase class II)